MIGLTLGINYRSADLNDSDMADASTDRETKLTLHEMTVEI